MCSGNGNPVAVTHEFTEHFRPGDHRYTAFASRHDFRIVNRHGARDDDDIRSRHMPLVVANLNFCAKTDKAVCYGTFLQIRSGHPITLVQQHLSL